jgi:hypothetical protein
MESGVADKIFIWVGGVYSGKMMEGIVGIREIMKNWVERVLIKNCCKNKHHAND